MVWSLQVADLRAEVRNMAPQSSSSRTDQFPAANATPSRGLADPQQVAGSDSGTLSASNGDSHGRTASADVGQLASQMPTDQHARSSLDLQLDLTLFALQLDECLSL